ncbi:glycosyl hydrolase family 28-related protein [Coraliomargarita algicola]|uniref:Glycosyl hydrolase family 28-related protein n=1 Tax=Coraliomargarita algicola TaxID=3092156 RepID=A0ABZ0RNH1_9BACT|nr:glycosyl hydrolase family 28-related protein [Coraliomargarita sp. J2-16]WPJ96774.1 glycosyl hydrolase family 28-related protein [Coraliomargarita sp. J2-16]
MATSLMLHGRAQIPVIDWVPASDWVNVLEHGAIGDGETDDTDALQTLLTAMRPGSVLYFPPGEYRITRELLLMKAQEGNPREKRLMGIGIYGHGADTVLKYDGKPGAVMLRMRGVLHYRMEGLVFDGGHKARVGMYHDNRLPEKMLFETHLYHEFITMRNFTEYGILFGDLDDTLGGASAETTFQYMVFENCGTGITFNKFNDYNFTFDGCTFRDNTRMGVECVNGNFYVRNSRFENNELDVFANPEHSSSIRRTVSVGSGTFLEFINSVSPFTVENCLVVDWQDASAIKASGAPMLLFDNRFENAEQKNAAINAKRGQQIVHAANSIVGVERLFLSDSDSYVTTELLDASPLSLHADMEFMPRSVQVPTRYFDVVEEFGALGDGQADDTAAIEAAIAAAKAHGKHAQVYLPHGKYRVTRSLRLEGRDYSFGGGTVYSEIYFDGDPDSDAIVVSAGGSLRLDTFRIKRTALEIRKEDRDEGWRVRTYKIGVFDGKGADIRQLPSESGSRVIYDTVYVTGKYLELPFQLGIRLEGLAAHDTVILHNTEGNLQFIDSGAATILQTVGYEGTFWVRGESRGGFLGVMTRLATLTKHSIFVEDSQSFVASDFYEEQAPPEAIVLTGKAGDVAGRLTLGFVKADRFIHIRNYVGEVNFVASQFYQHKSNPSPGIIIEGTSPSINLVSNYFYIPEFSVKPTGTEVNFVGSSGASPFNDAKVDINKVYKPGQVEGAIQDLRQLGLVDWQLNHSEMLQCSN